MMTSNRPLEDWRKLLVDLPSATAILDRLLHHAQILSITGRSYRLKDRAVPDEQAGSKARTQKDVIHEEIMPEETACKEPGK